MCIEFVAQSRNVLAPDRKKCVDSTYIGGPIMRSRGFSLLELMIVLTIVAGLTTLAIPNLIRAKMVANEASAIATVKTFGTSQELYKKIDWDANGTLEYAQNIGPSGGNGNLESLYLNVRTNTTTGLMNPAVIPAEIPSTGVMTGTTPKSGYVFFVQLGESFPSVKSYLNNKGYMMGGYAISAMPHQYSLSGISTFQMNSSGVIYSKDQGTNTLIASYNTNPANKWTVAE